MTRVALAVLAACSALVAQRGAVAQRPESAPPGPAVVVASKPFGESYLLAEMFAQVLESRGVLVVRRPGLGSTAVAFAALRANAIDVYPEYTGTGLVAILHASLPIPSRATVSRSSRTSRAGSRTNSACAGCRRSASRTPTPSPVRRETALRFHLKTFTDLARASHDLTGGFTADFIGRPDGLAGLSRAYGMSFRAVRPLSPALKYQALAAGSVDVIDGYSTDGLLSRYDLVTLEDDAKFFPPYEAARCSVRAWRAAGLTSSPRSRC